VITGYGLIESDGARSFHLAHGHIRVKGENFAEKLGHIHAEIGEIITQWQPQEVAVEQVFLSNNAMSALALRLPRLYHVSCPLLSMRRVWLRRLLPVRALPISSRYRRWSRLCCR